MGFKLSERIETLALERIPSKPNIEADSPLAHRFAFDSHTIIFEWFKYRVTWIVKANAGYFKPYENWRGGFE